MLFRAWELPTPEPILVSDGADILFGSMDAGYPNLKKRLGLSETLPEAIRAQLEIDCARIVCSWDDISKAMAADEAIANADRNLGNFLWDGSAHAYIDHERTLGLVQQEWNIIAELAKIAGAAEEIEKGGVAAALLMDSSTPSKLEAPEDFDFSTFVTYVEGQLKGLANRILSRFPKSHDLLTGLEPPPP
jgi:hypothetical protein